MASRIVHFEIHAENPDRAVTFYQTLFGWQVTKWGGPADYYLLTTGPDGTPGINGGLLLRRGPAPADGQPVNAFVCTASVDHLDDSLLKAESLGGRTAVPKMPIPGLGWLAYIKDTEGNILGLLQSAPNAQ